MEEKIKFKTCNDYNLIGLLNKVNDSDEIVIICHARLSSKDSRPTTRLSEEFNKNNLNTFRFDFIYCGESEGNLNDYTVTNMIKNLDDAIKMLKEKKGYQFFHLIGCSEGGKIVSLYNNDKFNIVDNMLWYPGTGGGKKALSELFNLPGKKERIAKRKGFYLMDGGRKISYEYLRDNRFYFPYKALSLKKIPILIVHGTKDPYVPYKNSVELSKYCINKKLILIENGDHGFHNEKNMIDAIKVTSEFIDNNRKYK